MRDIEFRVWDKVKKRMYEDVIGTTYMDELWWDKDCIKMQYSGLNDSGGNKIFEEDIVTDELANHHRLGKIIFKDGEFLIEWLVPYAKEKIYGRLRFLHKELTKICHSFQKDDGL